jgi:hypothetical protein
MERDDMMELELDDGEYDAGGDEGDGYGDDEHDHEYGNDVDE